MDQYTLAIISYVAGIIAALVGGATGAVLTNRYTRRQDRRRKEIEVIEEIYALALKVRMSIDPALVAASAPHTVIPSTWVEPMMRIVTLSNLYLPSLKPAIDKASESLINVENAFKRASYEQDAVDAMPNLDSPAFLVLSHAACKTR